MLKVITLMKHTVSAIALPLDGQHWIACYTVCNNGTLVQNGYAEAAQPSAEAAETVGMLYGIQLVRDRQSQAGSG